VLLAEANFDELVELVRDPENMASPTPGVVTVDGVEIRWSRVHRTAYNRGWSRATAYFSATS